MRTNCKVTAWEEWGQGEASVYLYYFPIQKAHAQSINHPVWECKIGRTKEEDVHEYVNKNKLKRDRSIFDISDSEYPEIPLIFKTDNPKRLEKQIHGILKLLGRWIKIPERKEWFFTNPSEVIQIYLFILDFDISI